MAEPHVGESVEAGGMGVLGAKVIEVLKPNPETIVRHENFRQRVRRIAMLESASSPNADVYLAEQLDSDTQKEKEVLTKIEQDDYGKFIDKVLDGDDVEKKSDLRITVMQQVFRPRRFLELHTKLHKKYEELKAASPEFAATITEEDYILEKMAQYVREARVLLTKARTRKALDSASGKETDTLKEKERREKIDKEIQKFVDVNGEALIDYEKQGQVKQKALRDAFFKIFTDNGCKEEDRAIIEELFGQIVSDEQFAVLTNVELEATLPEMIRMIQEGITDEDEWNARRKKVLEEKAPELLEEPKVQSQPHYIAGGEYSSERAASYSSVGEMAHESGVNLRSAPGKGPNVYEIHSRYMGARYRPLVRIVFRNPSSPDINDADIYVQDEWADRGTATEPVAGDIRGRKCSAAEFRMVVNKQILEWKRYQLQLDITTSQKESVNDILTDRDMMHMASRLFGFSLNARSLEDRHVRLYENFITVLMKEGEGDESLVGRKKALMNVLNDDKKVPYIRAILSEAPGRRAMTVKKLIEEVDVRMNRG